MRHQQLSGPGADGVNDSVSGHALRTLEEGRYNEKELMPLTEDFHTMQKFLDAQIETLKRSLVDDPSPGLIRLSRRLS